MASPPLSEKAYEQTILQAVAEIAETCETSISTFFTQTPFPKNASTLLINMKGHPNTSENIKNTLQSALRELYSGHYDFATHEFIKAYRMLSKISAHLISPLQCSQFVLLLPKLNQIRSEATANVRPLLEILASLHQSLKNHEEAASYLEQLAKYHLLNEDRDKAAKAFYAAGLQMSQEVPNEETCAKSSNLFKKFIDIMADAGNWQGCRKAMRQIIKQYTTLNETDSLFKCAACWEFTARRYCGDSLEKEASYLRRAIDLHTQLGIESKRADCLTSLAECFVRQENYPLASTTFREAGNIYEELDHLGQMAYCLRKTGECHSKKGDHLAAATEFDIAHSHYLEVNEPLIAAQCLYNAAYHYRNLLSPDHKSSAQCLAIAAELYMNNGYFQNAGECWCLAAESERVCGSFLQAAMHLDTAAGHFFAAKMIEKGVSCLESSAQLYETSQAYLSAAQAFRKAALFLKDLPEAQGRLAHFFYSSAECFAKGMADDAAAEGYDATDQVLHLATDPSRAHEYKTAYEKARLCRERLKACSQMHPVKPSAPWNSEIVSWLQQCTKGKDSSALKVLILSLEKYNAWPQIIESLETMPLSELADWEKKRKILLLICHPDKMLSELRQEPFFTQIEQVAAALLKRAISG
ncbi:MAG: hypothetical protein JST18_08495 [Bacteroidetes bacterium]|nr:hypothetical protein [Bacteroidota bacterium]